MSGALSVPIVHYPDSRSRVGCPAARTVSLIRSLSLWACAVTLVSSGGHSEMPQAGSLNHNEVSKVSP